MGKVKRFGEKSQKTNVGKSQMPNKSKFVNNPKQKNGMKNQNKVKSNNTQSRKFNKNVRLLKNNPLESDEVDDSNSETSESLGQNKKNKQGLKMFDGLQKEKKHISNTKEADDDDDDDDDDYEDMDSEEENSNISSMGIHISNGDDLDNESSDVDDTDDDDDDDDDDEDEDDNDDDDDDDDDEDDNDDEDEEEEDICKTKVVIDKLGDNGNNVTDENDEDEDESEGEDVHNDTKLVKKTAKQKNTSLELKDLLSDSWIKDDDDDEDYEEEEEEEDDDISMSDDEEVIPQKQKVKCGTEKNTLKTEKTVQSSKKVEQTKAQDKANDKSKKVKETKKVTSPKEEEQKLKRTLFVANIGVDCTEKNILQAFKKYGAIDSIRIRGAVPENPKMPLKAAIIQKKLHPKLSTVVAFIVYADQQSVKKALVMNGEKLNGNTLRVDLATNHQMSTENVDQKKAVFLGNLPFEITDDLIWEHFSKCGPIESVRLIRDRRTKLGKGFGYVNFKSQDSVTVALEMNGTTLNGRAIRVKISTPTDSKKRKRHDKQIDIIRSKKQKIDGKALSSNKVEDKKTNIKKENKVSGNLDVQKSKQQKQEQKQPQNKVQKNSNIPKDGKNTDDIEQNLKNFQGRKVDIQKQKRKGKLSKSNVQKKIMAAKLTAKSMKPQK